MDNVEEKFRTNEKEHTNKFGFDKLNQPNSNVSCETIITIRL